MAGMTSHDTISRLHLFDSETIIINLQIAVRAKIERLVSTETFDKIAATSSFRNIRFAIMAETKGKRW